MANKQTYWTSVDDKAFSTQEAAEAYEKAVAAHVESVMCSCGTKRASVFEPCPSIACHQDRIARLRGSKALFAHLSDEFAATRITTPIGWKRNLSERASRKWIERIAVACWSTWDAEDALRLRIANYDRQIAEEEQLVARLRETTSSPPPAS